MDITRNSYARTNNPKNLPYYPSNTLVKNKDVLEDYAEWEIEEFLKCKDSPVYFIENYTLLAGEFGTEFLKLHDYQKEAIQDITENNFTIILAPRRAGKSLTVLGFILHFAIFNSNKNVYVLSKTFTDSVKLLEKLRELYQTLPFFLQVGVESFSQKTIVLGNGSKIMTSSSKGVRGDHADLLYADEFSFLPNSSKFWQATYPLISSRQSARIIISSTPESVHGEFYNQYMNAVARSSRFIPIRWFWDKVPRTISNEEFKKITIANIGIEAWRTEFECEFLASSNTLIDGQVLSRLDSIEPIRVYSNVCNVYEEPIDKHKYVISVDVADGVGKDYSVMSIIDITLKPYKIVAVYRDNKVSPFELDTLVVSWAKRYNDAYVVIETNSRGADVANRVLNDHLYENMYVRDMSKPNGLGIDMKETIKKKGCISLKNLIETNMLVINDHNTLKELKTFQKTNTGSFAGAKGLHDDAVMSLVLFSILTSEPIFIDLQGSDKDINETMREIKLASLPQEFLLDAFTSNSYSAYEDMGHMANWFSGSNQSNQYDDVNYFMNWDD